MNHSNLFAVFPGQGSQHVGMGKDLYDSFPIARETFEEASDAIHLNLKKLCFDGPESDLNLTENTQPCLLTASVASFRVAEKELGFSPTGAAGHSLGEYSALVALGSLDLASAARWVRERGIAMQRAVPTGQGKMAAILGLQDTQVSELCVQATQNAEQKRNQNSDSENHPSEYTVRALVEPANFNAPGQVVIAGSSDAVEEALHLVRTDSHFSGAKAILLPVSAPFHCQLMSPARDRMAEIFSQATSQQKPKRPLCPYIPNRTARFSSEPGLIFDFLIEQVDHPVLWKQSMLSMLEASNSIAIEFGPGKVLSGLIKRIASHAGKTCTLGALNDAASLKNLNSILNQTQKQE